MSVRRKLHVTREVIGIAIGVVGILHSVKRLRQKIDAVRD